MVDTALIRCYFSFRDGRSQRPQMIRISKKADYAIFLLCFLARRSEDAEAGEGDLMSASELSQKVGLSHSLVANLLKDYARAEILDSVRGLHGGYRLAKSARELTLREILSVVEGPIHFVTCAEELAPGWSEDSISSCDLVPICPSKGPLQVLHNRIVEMLESTTLSELAQFSRRHGHAALVGGKK